MHLETVRATCPVNLNFFHLIILICGDEYSAITIIFLLISKCLYNHLQEDLVVGGKIILKWILDK
jgi:hypothetical protein